MERDERDAIENNNVARMKRQIAEAQTGVQPEGDALSDAELDALGRRK